MGTYLGTLEFAEPEKAIASRMRQSATRAATTIPTFFITGVTELYEYGFIQVVIVFRGPQGCQ